MRNSISKFETWKLWVAPLVMFVITTLEILMWNCPNNVLGIVEKILLQFAFLAAIAFLIQLFVEVLCALHLRSEELLEYSNKDFPENRILTYIIRRQYYHFIATLIWSLSLGLATGISPYLEASATTMTIYILCLVGAFITISLYVLLVVQNQNDFETLREITIVRHLEKSDDTYNNASEKIQTIIKHKKT